MTTFTQPERDSVDSGCSSGAEAANDVRPRSGQRDVIVPRTYSSRQIHSFIKTLISYFKKAMFIMHLGCFEDVLIWSLLA